MLLEIYIGRVITDNESVRSHSTNDSDRVMVCLGERFTVRRRALAFLIIENTVSFAIEGLCAKKGYIGLFLDLQFISFPLI